LTAKRSPSDKEVGTPDQGLRRLVSLSVLALTLTTPFFLYPLFERPSLSQIHYLTATGLAVLGLFSLGIAGFSPRFPNIPFALGAAWVFWGILFVSALVSGAFLFSLKELLFPLVCVGLFSALVLTEPRLQDARKILGLIGLVGFLAALYGVLQNYGFEILGYAAEEKRGKLNVVSIFGHPNYLAAYLTPLFVVLLNSWLAVRKIVFKILLVPVGLMFLMCLLLAGTRGAWLSLFVSLPLLFVFRTRRRGRAIPWKKLLLAIVVILLVGLLLLIVLLPLLGPRYNLRTRFGDVMPLLSRFYSWRIAGEMLKNHPVWGVGYGRYKVRYWEYVDAFQRRPENRIYDYLLDYGQGVPPLNVHNEFLEVAAESGLAGFAAFIIFLSSLFARGWRQLRNENGKSDAPVILPGIMAALFCILVDALFNFPLHQPLSAFLFWTLAALLFCRNDAPPQADLATSGKGD